MYAPGGFAESRPDVLREAIGAARVGHMVSSGPDGLEATLLPLLWEADAAHGHLVGHVAKANGHWQHLSGCDALVIFTVTDSYVSPSFYPSKSVDGQVVPTWNYVIVHAHGTVRVHHDAAWKEALVRRLTDRHEAERDARWSVDDAPRTYLDTMLRGIVGVEMIIDRLEGKWKLSQNRSAEDVQGVIVGLSAGSATDRRTAEMVRQRT
jgi:transcriptional regulator